MKTISQTGEILEQERQFWNAMQEKDAEAAAGMTDDGCIIVGAQGISSIDRKAMAKLTAEGKWELTRFTIDEDKAVVRFLDDDTAIVAYNVKEQVKVDGKTLDVDVNDSSVWVRREGEWRCALHTESLAGDPFGRDRKE